MLCRLVSLPSLVSSFGCFVLPRWLRGVCCRRRSPGSVGIGWEGLVPSLWLWRDGTQLEEVSPYEHVQTSEGPVLVSSFVCFVLPRWLCSVCCRRRSSIRCGSSGGEGFWLWRDGTQLEEVSPCEHVQTSEGLLHTGCAFARLAQLGEMTGRRFADFFDQNALHCGTLRRANVCNGSELPQLAGGGILRSAVCVGRVVLRVHGCVSSHIGCGFAVPLFAFTFSTVQILSQESKNKSNPTKAIKEPPSLPSFHSRQREQGKPLTKCSIPASMRAVAHDVDIDDGQARGRPGAWCSAGLGPCCVGQLGGGG